MALCDCVRLAFGNRLRRRSSTRAIQPTISNSVVNMELGADEVTFAESDTIGRGGFSTVYKGVRCCITAS